MRFHFFVFILSRPVVTSLGLSELLTPSALFTNITLLDRTRRRQLRNKLPPRFPRHRLRRRRSSQTRPHTTGLNLQHPISTTESTSLAHPIWWLRRQRHRISQFLGNHGFLGWGAWKQRQRISLAGSNAKASLFLAKREFGWGDDFQCWRGRRG